MQRSWLSFDSELLTRTPERTIEDKIPKHVPIKFKLKADKEKKIKDLSNPIGTETLRLKLQTPPTNQFISWNSGLFCPKSYLAMV